MSGGGDKSTYFFGLNHLNNTGSDKGSRFEKTNINYRGSFDFSDRISAEVQTIYSNNRNKSVPVLNYLSVQPYQRFLNADGTPANTFFAKESFDYFGFGGSYGTLNLGGCDCIRFFYFFTSVHLQKSLQFFHI